jgi:PAS domain S-box-containing protein
MITNLSGNGIDIDTIDNNELLKSALKLNLMQADSTVDELIVFAIKEAARLTKSRKGFYYKIDNIQNTLVFSGLIYDSESKSLRKGLNKFSINADSGLVSSIIKGDCILQNKVDTITKGMFLDIIGENENFILIPLIENQTTKSIIGVVGKNGDYFHLDFVASQLLGRSLYQVSRNKHTIDELNDKQKKFSYIVQNLNDVIWITDEDGKFTFLSPSAVKWLGYSEKEFNSLSIPEIVLPEYRQTTIEQIQKRKEEERQGIKTGDIEFIIPLVTKSGKVIPSEIKASSVYDSFSNFIGLAGVTRDVTLRVKAEQNLLESEKHLKETVAAKDKFLSIIAHDLKGPFSALVGLTELLLEKHDKMNSDSRNEIINAVYQSCVRTYGLLENLLAWSAIHTGRKRLDQVSFVIQDAININIELLSEVFKRKNIKVVFNKLLRTQVHADIDMVNTVIRNLLSNALKYTFPQGTIEIKVSDSSIDLVNISIKDTGIGISNSNIEKLFKIDLSFSTPGLENERGTGLGLILCKEFVEKNGGQIWVKSVPGVGSEFSFTLPVAK